MNARLLGCCLLFTLTCASLEAAQLEVEKQDDGVTIKIEGQLFARYLTRSGSKPVVWPIVGPTGKMITRQYPMKEAAAGEKGDHPHHRSLWFTHGDVNGISFWHEGGNGGIIEHREFKRLSGGEQAVVETVNDWVSADGKKICEDQRTLTFGSDGDARWIDFDITITASEKHEVKFGDTKEGMMGVRVAGTMKVDAKKGGKIVSSESKTDKAAWGKPAAWVDYHGPVDGETVGVAILNHPSSFRFPTHWHVRTYGLFAANPFGLHDFKTGKDGSHTLKPGEQMQFRYRILFHRGDQQQAKIAEHFDAYAKTK